MSEKETAGAGQECASQCPLLRACQVAQEMKGTLKRRMPAEFWEHRNAARREALLAFRSLIDAALTQAQPAPARRATRIKVE